MKHPLSVLVESLFAGTSFSPDMETPKASCGYSEDGYIIEIEAPGADLSTLQLMVNGENLEFSVSKKESSRIRDTHMEERNTKAFARVFRFGFLNKVADPGKKLDLEGNMKVSGDKGIISILIPLQKSRKATFEVS